MGLSKIDHIMFQKVVPQSRDYFLLCFHDPSTPDDSLLKTIEEISSRFPKNLQTYLVSEDDWDFFQNRFDFWGAPIYILLKNGREKERLLGNVSVEAMTKFICRNVTEA